MELLKPTTVEFNFDNGYCIIFDCCSGRINMYRGGYTTRHIHTKRKPSLDNAKWAIKTYPCKPIK